MFRIYFQWAVIISLNGLQRWKLCMKLKTWNKNKNNTPQTRWQDRILYLFDTGGINEEAMWQQSWRECVCAFVKNSFDKKIEVSHVCIRLRIIALVFRSNKKWTQTTKESWKSVTSEDLNDNRIIECDMCASALTMNYILAFAGWWDATTEWEKEKKAP